MQHELELGYVGVEVPHPASLSSFFGEVIGLVPGEPALPGESVTWRTDAKAQRIIVQPGPANDAVFVGLEATDEEAFQRVARRLEAAGYGVVEGDAEACDARRVRGLVRTLAPWGVSVEVVVGMAAASAGPFKSALVPSGFLTDGVGLGHVVFAVPDLLAAHSFLVEGLGFVESDWMEVPMGPGDLVLRFYHCNARHHTIALAAVPFELPQKLHHIMLEVNDRDDVGAALDRAWATELPIPSGLGRHDNDGMFSFYVASPAGFQIEFGQGGKVVGDDWDGYRRYDRASVWGHQPLRAG